MTVTSGFFNSFAGTEDRAYNAEQMGSIFDGILVDGVLSQVGDQLLVSANVNMDVLVGSGRAWWQNTWLENDADISITISDSFATLNRIDTIVMDFDKRDQTRDNVIMVVEGTLAASPVPPTLANELDHIQIPLADIYVGQGVTEILQANITNRVGTLDCPFASNPLDHVTTEALLTQWSDEFYIWFNNIQDNLDSNTEANLMAEILRVASRIPGRNIVVNGAMKVAQQRLYNGLAQPVSGANTGGYARTAPDRWNILTPVSGAFDVTQHPEGGKEWYRVEVDTGPTVTATELLMVRQIIEGERMQGALKGTAGAKDLTLSFQFQTNRAGTYVLEFKDMDNARHICKEIVVPGGSLGVPLSVTWVIPGDTVGTIDDDHDKSISLTIFLAAGSNYKSGVLPTSWASVVAGNRAVGQTNMVTVGDYFQFTEVQLEVSPFPTDFEYKQYENELWECRRYYESGYNDSQLIDNHFNSNNDGDVLIGPVEFRNIKRVFPNVFEIPPAKCSMVGSVDNYWPGFSLGWNNGKWLPWSNDNQERERECTYFQGYLDAGWSVTTGTSASHEGNVDVTIYYEADAELY